MDAEHDEVRSTALPYIKLLIALAISFLIMFALTMSMINAIDDFYLNLSNAYMALIMVFPMGIIMIAIMWSMFRIKALNVALIVAFAALFVGALFLGRTGALVGDKQFLESMIPHHSRAILVCEQSNLTDPEVITLCEQIIDAQEREIAQMKRILARY